MQMQPHDRPTAKRICVSSRWEFVHLNLAELEHAPLFYSISFHMLLGSERPALSQSRPGGSRAAARGSGLVNNPARGSVPLPYALALLEAPQRDVV